MLSSDFFLVEFEKKNILHEMYTESITCNLIPVRFFECLHSEMLVNCPPVLWKKREWF
jgi:hypothetical protein